jgi:hypothetical protein
MILASVCWSPSPWVNYGGAEDLPVPWPSFDEENQENR